MTIEHGHANLQNHDYASTAYWHQAEPHAAFPTLPSNADRLPRKDIPVPPAAVVAGGPWMDPAKRIVQWLAIGPFERPVGREPRAGVETAYPIEKDLRKLATGAGLSLRYAGKAGETGWQAVPDHCLAGGAVDLRKLFVEHPNVSVGFLMTHIHAVKARKARLWFSQDDGTKLWLNGRELYAFADPHAMFGTAPAEVDLDLNAGTNVLVMKVDQLGGAWGAWAYLGDATVKKQRPAKAAKPAPIVRKDLECWVETPPTAP